MLTSAWGAPVIYLVMHTATATTRGAMHVPYNSFYIPNMQQAMCYQQPAFVTLGTECQCLLQHQQQLQQPMHQHQRPFQQQQQRLLLNQTATQQQLPA